MTAAPATQADSRLGFRIAAATAVLTAGTFAIAVLTPPLSGPLCPAGCLDYPYADAASRFPRDYWWMYPALAAAYGIRREYRYEIAVISVDWLAIILVAGLAAAVFLRDGREAHA